MGRIYSAGLNSPPFATFELDKISVGKSFIRNPHLAILVIESFALYCQLSLVILIISAISFR